MLILGSKSKVRYQLLRLYNAEIKVMQADIDESFVKGKTIEENVKYLAYRKAQALIPKIDINNDILVCADTVVVVNGKVYNKPCSYDEAFKMIKSLENQSIKVVTGVYLSYQKDIHNFYDVATITFKDISDISIKKYLTDHNNYLDVAGALMIEYLHNYIDFSYEGSYTTIMGLPMEIISKFLYDDKNNNNISYSTPIIEPVNIYRSSVRTIVKEKDKIILLNGYTFNKKYTFLMSIGGGFHYFEDEKEIIKKEASEEGGLIIDNLKHIENIAEYTSNARYIDYTKYTIHSYYLSEIKEYTNPSYVEYEQELLIGIERHSIDDAIKILEEQIAFFDNYEYCQISRMSLCDLEILKKIKEKSFLDL